MIAPGRVVSTVAAATASIAVAATAAVLVRPEHWLIGSLFVVALVWAALPPAIDLLTDDRAPGPLSSGQAAVTAIIRLGDEPVEVARPNIVLAAAGGPTIVAVTRPRLALDGLASLGVRVCRAPTMEAAVHHAAALAETPAVLIVSASAYPRWDECRSAASALAGGVGWVVGSSAPFNRDGYAPEGRELLTARLRGRARRAGLELWEREAVIVRSDLLRTHHLGAGRPWGAWLRSRQHEGLASAEHPAALTSRASPAGANAFWHAAVTHKRAAAADLGDAIATTAGRRRLLAVGLLLRELHAYPLMVWLLAPLLIDGAGAFPFRCAPSLFFAVVASAAALRWMAARALVRAPLRPAQDALAVTYDVPGSLLALPSALTRRIRPTRFRLPDRPLVWLALLLTLLSALPLVGRSPDAPASRLAVPGALVVLAAVWAFAMRALLQRRWERSSYRFALPLPVTIDGVPATTVDASPGGIAASGELDGFATGREVEVALSLDDGSTIRTTGTVVDRRHRAEREVLGVTLHMDPQQQVRWYGELFRPEHFRPDVARAGPAVRADHVAVAPAAGGRVARAAERGVIALLGLTSAVAVGALLLVLVGYRPLVVRSGSMVPALRVGDVAIVEDVPARALRPDDIVTFPDPEGRGDTITHRVRAMVADEGDIHFETRGDANATSEYWTATPDDVLGRCAWKVPAVGRVLVALSTPAARAGMAGAALALVGVAAGRSFVRTRRATPRPA